jgi:tRNA1Val (adenine37-N6)-methyltransferase
MKVGTDSVLLGAYAKHQNPAHILDIGTGTGLLALMMAQKYPHAQITGVEIDLLAAQQAKQNCSMSKFSKQINIYHQDILLFEPTNAFDLIISNPPYFINKSNKSISDEQRSQARHDKALPFENLIDFTIKNLSDDGLFWLILPTNESQVFLKLSEGKLFLKTQINIFPKATKAANRVIMALAKKPTEVLKENFIIYHNNNNPTQAYIDITQAFYLWRNIDADERLKW